MKIADFDWDKSNRQKCRKHGVSISEIEYIFLNGPQIMPDLKHSTEEDRHIAIGRTRKGRQVFVAFTIRSKGNASLIRPVSARYMHAKEVKAYEEENSKTEV